MNKIARHEKNKVLCSDKFQSTNETSGGAPFLFFAACKAKAKREDLYLQMQRLPVGIHSQAKSEYDQVCMREMQRETPRNKCRR